MTTPAARKKPAPTAAELAAAGVTTTANGRALHEAGGAAGGAIAGAAMGSLAGPPGMVVGAVIGGAVGAIVAKVADEEAERVSFHEGELDATIGVNGGDLGAPNLKHPPATRGTYSAASSGGGSGGATSTSEGPMQEPED